MTQHLNCKYSVTPENFAPTFVRLFSRVLSINVLILPRDAKQSAVVPQYVMSSVRLSVTFRYRDHIGWST